MKQERIRNFSIIAHIDHGKSTLADRLLEKTHAVSVREMREQYLDSMDLERERGITIKAQTCRVFYTASDGIEYQLNLIDTPGHVDFTYEVSRALAACEGALLIVDAAQGVEAQTVANLYKAIDQNVEIIPIVNKIDLPSADIEGVSGQVHDLIGSKREEIIPCSAKTGQGIEEILEAIVQRIPYPVGKPDAPARALVFDSMFDVYRGAIAYVRMLDGTLNVGDPLYMIGEGDIYEIEELGVFTPKKLKVDSLEAGEVGYVIAGVKDISDIHIGDTFTHAERRADNPFPGYQPPQSMVFCGLYPVSPEQYEELRKSLEKLRLNDAAFHFDPESSVALGFGFRCGFLGMLHMEVSQERLEREFNLSLITTAPNVSYRVYTVTGEEIIVENPSELPSPNEIDNIQEPFINSSIITHTDYVGGIMKLAMERRGIDKGMEYLSPDRVMMKYEFPLSEVIMDFYDKLKSISRGYASFDYEFLEYRTGELVRLDMLLNGDPVDALSVIVHKEKAYQKGKLLAEKLRQVVPRQQYDVAIQASVGSRIIARETVKALRKNVLAKCYGGDISRKRKLLERQREGKRRLKNVGNIEIPQEAFMAILDI
ncbi:MAG: translation elongation factor 4 [Candidatus Hinthialibacter antarcticus]|nr:translation elongation factor 4 [Candidatus Hinthialibacter antarcticus]